MKYTEREKYLKETTWGLTEKAYKVRLQVKKIKSKENRQKFGARAEVAVVYN